MDRRIVVGLAVALSSAAAGCGSGGSATETPTGPTTAATGIRDDQALFRLVSQTDPFLRYTVFPNAEELTTGRLNGSEAHRPVIRVSLNSAAAAALHGGRLPADGRFPDGSIVFKEVKPSATAAASLYVVMVKDSEEAGELEALQAELARENAAVPSTIDTHGGTKP